MHNEYLPVLEIYTGFVPHPSVAYQCRNPTAKVPHSGDKDRTASSPKNIQLGGSRRVLCRGNTSADVEGASSVNFWLHPPLAVHRLFILVHSQSDLVRICNRQLSRSLCNALFKLASGNDLCSIGPDIGNPQLSLNRMSKKHSIQHRNALLPVSITLEGGCPWSEDKVLRVVQGVSGPLIPRFSVRVKVNDEIDEGCC